MRSRIHLVDYIEDKFGVFLGELDESFQILDAVEAFRMVFRHPDEILSERPLILLELRGGGLVDDMSPPHTFGLITGRVPVIPRAVNLPDGIGFVLADVGSMDLGYLLIRFGAERCDESRGDTRAPNQAMMVFDIGLIEVLAGEIRCRGLAEVSPSNWPVNIGTVSRLFENLALQAVADLFSTVKPAPQGCVGVGTGGTTTDTSIICTIRTYEDYCESVVMLKR